MWYVRPKRSGGIDPWVHMPLCQSRCFVLSFLKKERDTQKVIIIDSFSLSHLSFLYSPLPPSVPTLPYQSFLLPPLPILKDKDSQLQPKRQPCSINHHHHHHFSSHFLVHTLVQ